MGSNREETSPLADALARGLSNSTDLKEKLNALSNDTLTSETDARVLSRALGELTTRLISDEDSSLLRTLLGFFQGVDSREAYDVLRTEGVPHLLIVFDAKLDRISAEGDNAEALLFLLKIVSLYRHEGVVERVETAARRPLKPGSYLWSVLFETLDETHPYRIAVLNRLREPLPPGFIGVSYLDLANASAREGYVLTHPFDTSEGWERLRGMLTDTLHPSYAASASAALSFISCPARDQLLTLAMEHDSTSVQLEAARALAKTGCETALRLLVRTCKDYKHSRVASHYLTELGHGGLIPSEALAPDFVAVAIMSAWLAHPLEYGRPPNALEVVDSREVFWPPANDRRKLWLVAFRYDSGGTNGDIEHGVGLVGSMTFCLHGEVTRAMSPEDIYALHCCWELEVNHDPRAPAKRTIAAGRSLLASG